MKTNYEITSQNALSSIKKSKNRSDVILLLEKWAGWGMNFQKKCLNWNNEIKTGLLPEREVDGSVMRFLLYCGYTDLVVDIFNNKDMVWLKEVLGLKEVKINDFEIGGYGLMHMAATINSSGVIEKLKNAGVDIEWGVGKITTPLGYASMWNCDKSVIELSGLGASWTSVNMAEKMDADDNGWSVRSGKLTETKPWALALETNSVKIFEEMISRYRIDGVEFKTTNAVSRGETGFMVTSDIFKNVERVEGLSFNSFRTVKWWKSFKSSYVFTNLFDDDGRKSFFDSLLKMRSQRSSVHTVFAKELVLSRGNTNFIEYGIELLKQRANIDILLKHFTKENIKLFLDSSAFKYTKPDSERVNISLWTDVILGRTEVIKVFGPYITKDMAINFWKDLKYLKDMKHQGSAILYPNVGKAFRVRNLDKSAKLVLDKHFSTDKDVKVVFDNFLNVLLKESDLYDLGQWKGVLEWAHVKGFVSSSDLLKCLSGSTLGVFSDTKIVFEDWNRELQKNILIKDSMVAKSLNKNIKSL